MLEGKEIDIGLADLSLTYSRAQVAFLFVILGFVNTDTTLYVIMDVCLSVLSFLKL